MEKQHRVHGHLGVHAGEYDAQARRFIPGYEELLATMVRWLEGHVPGGGLVIDLGAGTGALSVAVLRALPAVRVRMVDVDPAMLQEAFWRCAAFPDRIESRNVTFAEGLCECDAVVASLALHHVADPFQKRALFAKVHEVLRPGGLFVIGDATVHAEGRERERLVDEWTKGMQAAGISAEAAREHFAHWQTEDFYRPLSAELADLAAVGFARPDCFWKRGVITVYGAFK